MDLKDKVAIITGASRGLGKEIALKLAEKGSKLVLCSRNEKDLLVVKEEISKKNNVQIIIVKADVTKAKDVENVFSHAIKRFKKIDILVNNAGMNIKKQFFEYSEEEWDTVMNTNIKAIFLFTKQANKYMKKGKIVIISSVAGLFGSKYYSAYCASKHAVEGYTKSIKKEISKNIKIHVFHPYRLKTHFDKGYKIKSPEHHMIPPSLYAEYIVSVLEKNYLLASFYFMRNVILWLVKLII